MLCFNSALTGFSIIKAIHVSQLDNAPIFEQVFYDNVYVVNSLTGPNSTQYFHSMSHKSYLTAKHYKNTFLSSTLEPFLAVAKHRSYSSLPVVVLHHRYST